MPIDHQQKKLKADIMLIYTMAFCICFTLPIYISAWIYRIYFPELAAGPVFIQTDEALEAIILVMAASIFYITLGLLLTYFFSNFLLFFIIRLFWCKKYTAEEVVGAMNRIEARMENDAGIMMGSLHRISILKRWQLRAKQRTIKIVQNAFADKLENR